MQPKRALLIDLGNVLVRYDHAQTLRRIAAEVGEREPERLRPALFGPAEREFDLGNLTPSGFFRAVEKSASLPRIPDEIWIPAWRDIFEPIPESLDLLSLLRPEIRSVLVSNTNVLHWEGVLSVSDVERRVDALSLSFRVGAVKPASDLFLHALSQAESTPAEAVFADDRRAFVDAARELGMAGIEVRSPADLREGLHRNGLLRDIGSSASLMER